MARRKPARLLRDKAKKARANEDHEAAILRHFVLSGADRGACGLAHGASLKTLHDHGAGGADYCLVAAMGLALACGGIPPVERARSLGAIVGIAAEIMDQAERRGGDTPPAGAP